MRLLILKKRKFIGCRGLVEEGKTIEKSKKIMVKTFDSIKQKMVDLKLSVKEKTLVPPKKTIFSSS